jgi:hypothetical protein
MTAQNTMADGNRFFPQISQFVLSRSLLDETVRVLQTEGRYKVESILFWAGTVRDGIATVSDVLVPKGPGVIKRPLQVSVDDRTIAALCDILDPPRLVLLGQVHTHIGSAFHSYTDDHFCFETAGFLSVVVPHGARKGAGEWRKWAFFECRGGPRFKALTKSDLKRRFAIGSHNGQVHEINAQ